MDDKSGESIEDSKKTVNEESKADGNVKALTTKVLVIITTYNYIIVLLLVSFNWSCVSKKMNVFSLVFTKYKKKYFPTYPGNMMAPAILRTKWLTTPLSSNEQLTAHTTQPAT